jgi:serine phosphatase RsbU (regulator of sigma subunit)
VHPFRNTESPIIRQIPIVLTMLLALASTAVIPSAAITNPTGAVVGGAIAAVATVWAAITGRVERLAALAPLVPTLDFLALAVQRASTGGTSSIFTGIVILPVLWFAMLDGRRNVLYASAGGLIVAVVPIFATGGYLANPGELLRGLLAAILYAVAAGTVNNLYRRAREQFREMQRRDLARGQELARGGAAQQALLPGNTAAFGSYRLAGVCLPASAVGGDFYDWYPTPDGFAVTLGDVMGKGAGAAIIAATARAVVRGAREEADPLVAVTRADQSLATEILNMSSFATMFHARISRDGRVRYVDAGHGLTLVLRRQGAWERLGSTGVPLGIGFGSQRASHDIRLESGESLVTFSDGLLDLYGGDEAALRVIASLLLTAPTPEEQIDLLVASASGMVQEDDLTVVALRRD